MNTVCVAQTPGIMTYGPTLPRLLQPRSERFVNMVPRERERECVCVCVSVYQSLPIVVLFMHCHLFAGDLDHPFDTLHSHICWYAHYYTLLPL